MYSGERWPDVLGYVSPEPRQINPGEPETVWLAIDWDTLVKKTREHLLGRLRNPNFPDGVLAEYYSRAKSLPPDVWANLCISSDPRRLQPVTRVLRAEALDLLRLWFTEHLNRALDVGPDRRLGLHLGPKDERYRQ